ncbi:MAG: hypothetical protein M3021_03130, partial [Actinomycetota bacterium]|nr:hypothetical protein [Actinomycetota bacterium]
MNEMNLSAVALVCALAPPPEPSSSELLARQILEHLKNHGVSGSVLRVVDWDVHPRWRPLSEMGTAPIRSALT